MSEHTFDYLTGCVRLSVPRPAELAESLYVFYEDPNNERWGHHVCRVLYHETVHFWQFLASAYLGNMIASEWTRVEAFRDTGAITAPSSIVTAFRQRIGGAPFSAYELTECWARFWDVHTRNPEQIIEEEGIEAKLPEDPRGYSGVSFDSVMQTGTQHSKYAAPYRWMLGLMTEAPWIQKLAGSEKVAAEIASYLVVFLFPALAHAAFGSPEPVGVVCGALEIVAANEALGREILKNKSGRINFDWLNGWSFCQGEIIRPVLKGMQMPTFTSGIDVIQRGALQRHPLFPAYLTRLQLLGGMVKLELAAFRSKLAKDLPLEDGGYRWALTDIPTKDPWILFGQPGQPNFRMMLGRQMHPPAVQFEDATEIAGATVMAKVAELSGLALGDPAVGTVSLAEVEKLRELIRRFRDAEYAVSKGLPPDAFASRD